MKVLITGASGLLGKALIQTKPKNVDLVLCSSKNSKVSNWLQIDVSDRDDIGLIVKENPEIIIHCAAVGSVDKIQSEPNVGIDVNLFGVINMLDAASKTNAKIIIVSTNAVFDGNNPPYNEESILAPVNNYGIIKSCAEFCVRNSTIDWIIVRPILMYGNNNPGRRGNWVTIWIDKLTKNEKCKVVDDTVTQPLYSIDCAMAIWNAINLNEWNEVYNLAGPEIVQFVDFARKVAQSINCDESLIVPVKSTEFPSIAPRPIDTSYDISKMVNKLKINPVDIKTGVKMMLSERLNGH